MPAPGDRLADRYRIVAPLGAGGMATVHRAVDERLGRDVAIKILLPNHAADPAVAARFEGEARSMASVAHQGVVAVFDVDPGDRAAGREPFFVMELCPGGSLAGRLVDGRRISPDELIPILVSVADGLAGLHHAGLVHRDVKPSNILFAADRAKLADLGLAQPELDAGSGAITAPGTAVGTLAYLAPELLRGERAGPAADIFALATVAFLGLTGRLPRPATSMADLVRAAESTPPLVSVAAPELGPAFDEAIVAGLNARPSARPDALGFGAALTTALGRWSRTGRAGSTVSAAPPVGAQPAIAPGPPPQPADDATTRIALPLAATAAIPLAGVETGLEPRARQGAPPTTARRTGWLPLAALAVAIVLAALVLPRLLSSSGSLPTTSPANRLSAAPSAAASVPPSRAPSAVPSATADPALAALDAVEGAVSQARGGPDGLKGKKANDLENLVAKVRSDLLAGNRSTARKDAQILDDRISKFADGLRADVRARLTGTSGDLVRARGG